MKGIGMAGVLATMGFRNVIVRYPRAQRVSRGGPWLFARLAPLSRGCG